MISQEDFAKRLSQGSIHLTSSLIERGLRSARLRGLVLDQLEKRLVAQTIADAGTQPRQAVNDQIDMERALLASIERGLDRNRIGPAFTKRFLKTLLTNWILRPDGMRRLEQGFAESHDVPRPPVTMVISPTKACNLHCVGCYASSGMETANRLDWQVFDRILAEAKDLWGMRFFTISGGEPLAYRSHGKDLLDAAIEHDDCFIMMYTNGTLIDERMAERMAEAGNLIPAISVEGLEAPTDQRRGAGVFARILQAMANLRRAGVPFGISLTATRHNAEEILSDPFIDFFFEEQQAMFGWIFQYMPIGRGYTLDLVVTPEQRLQMWRRTWQIIRERKLMLADFWNCGTTSKGCIAAGRNGGYLYIDWNGKVMPCVFVPYAAANIHELYDNGGTLDSIYELPYLRAIRQWQWDYALGKERPEEYGNWLLPCSLRDHYGMGRALIDQYQPEPEDEAAALALGDGNYYEGMLAYDEELYELFDPIWEREYLSTGS